MSEDERFIEQGRIAKRRKALEADLKTHAAMVVLFRQDLNQLATYLDRFVSDPNKIEIAASTMDLIDRVADKAKLLDLLDTMKREAAAHKELTDQISKF